MQTGAVAPARRPGLPSAATSGFQRRAWALACAVIAAMAIAAYSNSLAGPFVWDDAPSIVDNPTIRSLWPIWGPLNPPTGGGITVEGRPVLNLSLAINHAFGGNRVEGYHAVNLLIHVLAGLTLFGFLRRTLRSCKRFAESADGLAFAISLLWTVHPLQTEAVTYVVQRAESLMGLFYLFCLYGFVRAFEEPSRVHRSWWVLSWCSCLLAMGTKEVAASIPIVVLLWDRTFLGGSFAEAWRRRGGYYLALAGTWILLGFLVISGGGNRSGTVGFGAAPWTAYLLTQPAAYARYLSLSFWPHPLIFDYATAWVTGPGDVLPCALLMTALFAGAIWALRTKPAAGFAAASFFLILAPTTLAAGNSQMIVEHRMYLPLAAVIGLVVCSAHTLFSSQKAVVACAVALAGLFAVVTYRRNAVYSTALSLWTDTVLHCPENPVAHDMRGLALDAAGQNPAARQEYREAIRLKPDYAEAHGNLGIALDEAGKPEEAIAQYEASLRLKSASPKVRNNLGLALESLGRLPEAISEFEEALPLSPGDSRLHYNLGVALSRSGNLSAAMVQYSEAIRLAPSDPSPHFDLGIALERGGRAEEAAEQYGEAIRLKPGFAQAHNNLGANLQGRGHLVEAVAEFRRALDLDPNLGRAHNNLGVALRSAGRLDEAAAEFKAAIASDPSLAAASDNLGIVLAVQGKYPDAVEAFKAALRLDPANPEVHENLGMALRASGREGEAAIELREAVHIRSGN